MSEITYVVRRARVDDAEEVFSLVENFPPEAIADRQIFQATFAALDETAGSALFVAESGGGTVLGYILVSCIRPSSPTLLLHGWKKSWSHMRGGAQGWGKR